MISESAFYLGLTVVVVYMTILFILVLSKMQDHKSTLEWYLDEIRRKVTLTQEDASEILTRDAEEGDNPTRIVVEHHLKPTFTEGEFTGIDPYISKRYAEDTPSDGELSREQAWKLRGLR